MLEHLDRVGDRVEIKAGPLLDDRQAIVLDVLQMIQHQGPDDVAVRRLRSHLKQEAFLIIAGRHAWRIEALQVLQRRLQLDWIGGRLGLPTNVIERGREVAAVIDVRN